MATTYCTVQDLSSFLQLMVPDGKARKQFTSGTDPAYDEVEAWINETEDYVDQYTHSAWRELTITDETHESKGYQKIQSRARVLAVIVHLQHRPIKVLSTGSGDKLEYFDGSNWRDLLLIATEGEGPGDSDFWVDLRKGKVYLQSYAPVRGSATIRVTYRYGKTPVPNTIKRATLLLTAIQFLRADDYKREFPDNSQTFSVESKATSFRSEAHRIMDMYKEFITL